jgi:pSer/pThr/pTyr-binding forkhead associated (FHA) protein
MGDVTLARGRRPEPFGAPHVLVLAVIEGDDLAAVHRITSAETVIGRGAEADFGLTDGAVSKRHVAIRVDGSVYTLIDLESTNGTRLNDRKLSPGARERLKHMDDFRIGETRILFTATRFRTNG